MLMDIIVLRQDLIRIELIIYRMYRSAVETYFAVAVKCTIRLVSSQDPPRHKRSQVVTCIGVKKRLPRPQIFPRLEISLSPPE